MDRIKLSKGIIAIGGPAKDEASLFSMKLANHIAQEENVLYLTYVSYKVKIQKEIERMDGSVNSKLFIEDDFEHLTVASLLRIISYIKEKAITTIFIDDIDIFRVQGCEICCDERSQALLDSLQYLSGTYSTRILFNASLKNPEDLLDYSLPKLPCFLLEKQLTSVCTQLYIVNRLMAHGITEDEIGLSTENQIEILFVKNERGENEILELDNKKLRIYT